MVHKVLSSNSLRGDRNPNLEGGIRSGGPETSKEPKRILSSFEADRTRPLARKTELGAEATPSYRTRDPCPDEGVRGSLQPAEQRMTAEGDPLEDTNSRMSSTKGKSLGEDFLPKRDTPAVAPLRQSLVGTPRKTQG